MYVCKVKGKGKGITLI